MIHLRNQNNPPIVSSNIADYILHLKKRKGRSQQEDRQKALRTENLEKAFLQESSSVDMRPLIGHLQREHLQKSHSIEKKQKFQKDILQKEASFKGSSIKQYLFMIYKAKVLRTEYLEKVSQNQQALKCSSMYKKSS